MNFLQKIAAEKTREVKAQKSRFPVLHLEKTKYFPRQTVSLLNALNNKDSFNIISEFKRKSPSTGLINDSSEPQEVCRGYRMAGASAVSVLTEFSYFNGQNSDLSGVREVVDCPILRKDFIIDEYQIIEAKSIGADAVLLIAELHTADKLDILFRLASSLGLEVLIEVHEKPSISKIPKDSMIVGINSRDLSTLSVNPEYASQLISLLPEKVVKVAESGIRSADDCINLRIAGFDAFLIGEYFMRSDNPGNKCREFISDLNSIMSKSPNKLSHDR